MNRAAALTLATLCGCAVDDRPVQVGRVCVDAPAGGLISDFSAARAGNCSPETCPELAGSPVVSLGVEGPRGLVYPYRRPTSTALTLAPTGDLQKVRDDTSAVQVVVAYDSTGLEPPPLVGAFALQLFDCVTTSGYVGVSYSLSGTLGACPLRFTARFAAHGDDLTTPPCTLDDCYANTTQAATLGVNTARLSAPAADLALLGLQWELGVPADGARTCAADFTIDDVRLIVGP